MKEDEEERQDALCKQKTCGYLELLAYRTRALKRLALAMVNDSRHEIWNGLGRRTWLVGSDAVDNIVEAS